MQKPMPYACDEYCTFQVFRRQNFDKKVPKVLSNAFSYGGQRADFFVNFTKEAVTVSIPKVEGERLYLTAEDYKAGKTMQREEEKVTIAPLSILLLEHDL
jgi:hypothetical protein